MPLAEELWSRFLRTSHSSNQPLGCIVPTISLCVFYSATASKNNTPSILLCFNRAIDWRHQSHFGISPSKSLVACRSCSSSILLLCFSQAIISTCLAGEDGIEPPMSASKTDALATWLLPIGAARKIRTFDKEIRSLLLFL